MTDALKPRAADPTTEPAPASEAPDAIHLPPPADPAPAERPKRQRRGGGAGRHFGRPPVADPRSARMQIRCTPRTQAKAQAAAEAAALSLSGYVCALIDGTPGPRAHRNPTELTKAGVQLAAQMGKRGGNLNQSSKAFNEIKLAITIGTLEVTSRDRLADLLEEGMELYRVGIADHRSACADIERTFGGRGDDDY